MQTEGWPPRRACASGQATGAGDTLADALVAADAAPQLPGAVLAETARAAFTSGFVAVAAVGAVLALVLAMLSMALLRGAREDRATADEVRPRGGEVARRCG